MASNEKYLKKIILIVGANGVGKSAVSKKLLSVLPNSAYIDSDSCRAINPFQFTEETKLAVKQNIYCMFHNYLLCKDIQTIIFPYSFHGQRKVLWEQILEQLKVDGLSFEVVPIILKCSWDENVRRTRLDNREQERIERGMKNTFNLYDNYSYPMIDTTYLNIDEVAEKILEMI